MSIIGEGGIIHTQGNEANILDNSIVHNNSTKDINIGRHRSSIKNVSNVTLSMKLKE